MSRCTVSVLCAALAAAQALPANAGGHPWPMYHRDLARTGQAAVAGPRLLDLKWSADLGPGTVANYASPVVDAQGRVYIGTADGSLRVFNPDGTPAWTYNTGAVQSTFFGDQNTPSAAVAADGSVYVLDAVGSLHRLTSSGAHVWTYDSPGTSADSHPAVLPNGDVLIAVYEYFPPVGANGHLVCVRPDGTVRWSRTHPGVGPVLSAPAVAPDGSIYVAAFQYLYKYDAAGNPVWTYVNPGHMYCTPTIAPGGRILLTDQAGYMLAVDPVSGGEVWSSRFGVFSQAPVAVTADGLAVGAAWPGVVAALETASGNPLWQFQTVVDGSARRARSAASLDAAGDAYFGVDNGMIFALDRRGRMLWSLNVGTRTRSTPAFDAQGNLYIATDTPSGARLLCFSAVSPGVATVGAAKALADGQPVSLPGKPVTFTGSGYFVIQDWDRAAAVRVVSGAQVAVGDVVNVSGLMGVHEMERAIVQAEVQRLGRCVLPAPVHMAVRDLAGPWQGANPGVQDGRGPNNVSLLVKVSGEVSTIQALDDGFTFFLTDGSGTVRVYSPVEPSSWFVTVTGVVGLEIQGDGVRPVVRLRTAADIQPQS